VFELGVSDETASTTVRLFLALFNTLKSCIDLKEWELPVNYGDKLARFAEVTDALRRAGNVCRNWEKNFSFRMNFVTKGKYTFSACFPSSADKYAPPGFIAGIQVTKRDLPT